MTDIIFGKNLSDVYFEFLVRSMSHLLTWSRQEVIKMFWLPFEVVLCCLSLFHSEHLTQQSWSILGTTET